ncbi:MAG: dihydropyrimidinase [Tissierellia bacterium]|nr:dihydropyrimidinase [Tissierellia bacterium]
MSILIKNVKMMDHKGRFDGDLLIEKGKIKAKGKNLKEDADEIIDGEGKLLLPGGIDVHTHMELDLGEYISVDDFYTGTVAAAHGGTTAIVDHIAFGPKGCSLASMIDHYHDLAGPKAIIDYSFHGVIQDVDQEHLEELGPMMDEGIISLKMYTTYGGMLNDQEMLKVLKKAKETDTVVCVHCENDGAIAELRQEAEKEGNLTPIYHGKTRPSATEAEAVNRLIYLSEIADFPKLYIVHTSTKEALDEIKKARERGVKNLFCETCTQYLVLTDGKYEDGGSAEGIKYIMAPPLRKKEDNEALWKGIEQGDVDVVATDHCPFFYERDKLPHKDHFTTAPGGAPGVEERMEIVLSEGLKRGIPMERLIEVLVVNPAKIFGLAPQKGDLSIGADADLVLYEEKSYKISQDNRHSRTDYTTYEGKKVDLKVNKVFSNGRLIIDGDQLLAEKGSGKFIKRKV